MKLLYKVLAAIEIRVAALNHQDDVIRKRTMTRTVPSAQGKVDALMVNSHAVTHHRGFTLVEVMISVVLVAVITTLALPSYNDMVEKRMLVMNVEQIAAFLNSVQSISIYSNQAVTVHHDRDGHRNWCIGASFDTDPDSTTGDCDCEETDPSASSFCAINGVEYRMDDDDTDDMRFMHKMEGSTSGDHTYTIDPIRGLLWDTSDSLYLSMHHDASNYHLDIKVSSTGEVIVCSRKSDEAIPGYPVCT